MTADVSFYLSSFVDDKVLPIITTMHSVNPLALKCWTGRQRIAVYIGRQLRLEYLDVPSKPVVSLTFDVTVEPETWYHVAIKVQGRQAVLYFDCNIVIEKKMKRGSNSLGTNLMLSVGPYFANYGSAFEVALVFIFGFVFVFVSN